MSPLVPFLPLFGPIVAFVVVPLWLKSVGKLSNILPAFVGSLMLEAIGIYAWWQGVKASCAINESECIGATGFFFIALVWVGLLTLIGAAFAALAFFHKPDAGSQGA
jgi:hypothetical protein